ncbi:protein disulfide isomerase MPD2 Ecym_5339 [Eremothecium cymbalariae DBVPG|uniref:Thioredoxin domain-containing protein n=1 Tax=Eremothecium cymbalariae (strain CBS 270.75 / DBVPG 7215 / KCTC 17166 / NRRL Y-17582) TaxID=931890 RepID=I6NDF6_ERECY|nr:hypothetical protein Ecym_5339 [Eremothecium cymbalariae DBVPG\
MQIQFTKAKCVYPAITLFLLICMPSSTLAKVEEVGTLQQFIDKVNTEKNYTLVEYYTTWCSHCKKLGPIFEDVSESLGTELGESQPIEFLKVDCDKFDGTLCKRLPGFPVVELYRPAKGFVKQQEEEESVAQDERALKRSLWDWLSGSLSFITRKTQQQRLSWELDPARIVEFKGNRNKDTFTKFVKSVVERDRFARIAEVVFSDGEANVDGEGGDYDRLVKVGRDFISFVSRDLKSDRKKLQNILKHQEDNEEGAENYEAVKFQLYLLGLVEEQQAHKGLMDDEL